MNFLITKVLAQAWENANAQPGGSPNQVPGSGVLTNYLKVETIVELIKALLRLIVQIGLPIVVLMIVYSGFLYVTARGDKAQVSRAHEAILYTLLGAILVLGAGVISEAIQGTITNLK